MHSLNTEQHLLLCIIWKQFWSVSGKHKLFQEIFIFIAPNIYKMAAHKPKKKTSFHNVFFDFVKKMDHTATD